MVNTDDWKNFLERVNCNSEDLEEKLKSSEELEEKLRLWASYRGQTLTKTGINIVSSLYKHSVFLFISYWFY